MTDRQLHAELAAVGVLLAQFSGRDLLKLVMKSPPAGHWSRMLAALVHRELERRTLRERAGIGAR